MIAPRIVTVEFTVLASSDDEAVGLIKSEIPSNDELIEFHGKINGRPVVEHDFIGVR